LLADELGKELRPQRRLDHVVVTALGGDKATGGRHPILARISHHAGPSVVFHFFDPG
jgi:hypothetical protein